MTSTWGIGNCMTLYKQFNHSFGLLRFVLVYIFLVISFILTDSHNKQIMMEISLLFNVFGHLLYMSAIVMGLDDVHNNLLELFDVLYAVEE